MERVLVEQGTRRFCDFSALEFALLQAYINQFTQILQKEFADSKICIQLVCPLFVTTKMSKLRRASIFVPSAPTFARAAVRTISLAETTTGCLSHDLQQFAVITLVPSSLLDFFVRRHAFRVRQLVAEKKAATKVQ